SIEFSRSRVVRANAKRLQLGCIRTETADLTTLDLENSIEDSLFPQPESCDRALVDAPCSGLGTLHRHADARWRQQLDSIDTLLETQANILDRAAQWVKPGGIMVYSTCTIFAPENQEQVDRFLDTHPNWQLDPECSPQQNWPHKDERDGFYMARLQKLSLERS
ncbi:MAG: 16S rRNA (cytosine(967)-C(5))-methyltransferase, partial [Cyanobacteria bacterium J06597_1]